MLRNMQLLNQPRNTEVIPNPAFNKTWYYYSTINKIDSITPEKELTNLESRSAGIIHPE